MIKIFFGGDLSYKNMILEVLRKEDFVLVNNYSKYVDIIYWVYGGGPDLLSNISIWIKKRPFMIIHWIGTDVLNWKMKLEQGNFISKIYYRLWKFIINVKMRKGGLINLSGAEWLKEELFEIGIKSEVIPITTINKDLINLNSYNDIREIDFISYTPFNRFDFYGGPKILKFAKLLPEYKFTLILPDQNKINYNFFKTLPSNVELKPKIEFFEMQRLLRNSKCFLRFTKHDGLSLSVLEALLANTQVIWTYKFPHTQIINLSESDAIIINKLKNIINNWEPNECGRKYVIDNYTSNNFKDMFNKILDKII